MNEVQKYGWGPEEPLTLGLLDARSDTTQEIIWCHKYLMITMVPMHLQSCKVSKDLVWSWILSYTVLILNDLEIMVKLAWMHPHNTTKYLSLPSMETRFTRAEENTSFTTYIWPSRNSIKKSPYESTGRMGTSKFPILLVYLNTWKVVNKWKY